MEDRFGKIRKCFYGSFVQLAKSFHFACVQQFGSLLGMLQVTLM